MLLYLKLSLFTSPFAIGLFRVLKPFKLTSTWSFFLVNAFLLYLNNKAIKVIEGGTEIRKLLLQLKWVLITNQIFKGLLHFTLPTCNVFCTLPYRVQNWAMYHSSFIIVCNVHFLRDNVIFLDRKACALHVIEGKRVNFKKTLTNPPISSFFFFFSLYSFSLLLNPQSSILSLMRWKSQFKWLHLLKF